MAQLMRALMALLLVSAVHAEEQWHLVAEVDCGRQGADELFLTKGEPYLFADAGHAQARTCAFGDPVQYVFEGMDIAADYRLEAGFYSDAPRTVRLVADTTELAVVELSAGRVTEWKLDLQRFAYAYSVLQLNVEKVAGPNAVISWIKLSSTNPAKLRPPAKRAAEANFDYGSVPVPRPVYAPVPAAVAGVAQPVLSLNGVWEFNPAPSGNEPGGDGDWAPIEVPGHWATQEFTVEKGRHAAYRREFDVPEDWAGRQVRLRFDSVFSDCQVFVNGQRAGSNVGTFMAFELDVTGLVRPGRNTLALLVRSDSEADNLGSLMQYANFDLGGILRKVTLFALPQVHVSDLRLVTAFDKNYTDSELHVEIALRNGGARQSAPCTVEIAVPGAIVEGVAVPIPAIPAGQEVVLTPMIPVKRPRLWDDEHPNLYTAEIRVLAAGEPTQLVTERFGFREVKVEGNRLLLNGQPLKLRGVCRHEAHPLKGRVLDDALWRKDAEVFLEGNCNFIRTSHYPPGDEFLDYCDEMGLLVELEAPIGWVGHHANQSWRQLDHRSPKWYPYLLKANIETLRFHRNHPSVIMHSIANESVWSRNFAEVLQRVQAEEPSVPFVFHDQAYGTFNNHGSLAPVANIHYPGPDGAMTVEDFPRPIVFGEYCHLNVYNREELVTDPGTRVFWGTVLRDMWEKMVDVPAVLGGSIWSGIDDLFLLPDGRAVGYGGWGPIDGWRRPKPEYFFMKEVYAPVVVHGGPRWVDGGVALEVENRHTFTNLAELTIHWHQGDASGGATADIPPATRGTLVLPVARRDLSLTLTVEFMSPKGFLVRRCEFQPGSKGPQVAGLPARPVRVEPSGDDRVVTGDGFQVVVDGKTGLLRGLERDGKMVVDSGPWLMVLPLRGGKCRPDHSADTPAWDPLCTDWNAESVEVRPAAEQVTVITKGAYREAGGSFTCVIHGNGELEFSYDFVMKEAVDPRQVGMTWFLDRSFRTLEWERRADGFGGFPVDHIARPKGRAPAFHDTPPSHETGGDGTVKRRFVREKPQHPWSHDANELGCNDFRSTKGNILRYALTGDAGTRVTLWSDGTQSGRCRVDGSRVRLIAVDVDTAGAELFLGGHLKPYRRPLAVGDRITGSARLRVEGGRRPAGGGGERGSTGPDR